MAWGSCTRCEGSRSVGNVQRLCHIQCIIRMLVGNKTLERLSPCRSIWFDSLVLHPPG